MPIDATCLIPPAEFARVRESSRLDEFERLALMADMCRLNALNAVKRAGSGHLGTSFSAMDIMVLLYHRVMNVRELGPDHPDRDVFISSKGHDVPAQYSVLHSIGILPTEKLLKLRRLGGLEGHPNVQVKGIEANTGSLGMGISKGRGALAAKRLLGRGGRVFVLTGDGELQEGQNFEALQSAAHHRSGLTVIVDHNKVQSDKPVAEITDLRDLVAKFAAFGWRVERCDGHDLRAMTSVLERFDALGDVPRILVADTIKGRGVSFMEHPVALKDGKGTYRWHAGAPDDESYLSAQRELAERIGRRFAAAGLGSPVIEAVPTGPRAGGAVSDEYLVEAFGSRLVELGRRHPELVVLDADLAADCRTRKFELAIPERFYQNGIAEQDMVSMAGAMARHGLLPVVNSFATFLAARANEQIYNNVTEGSRVIYVCHFGGLIPAGPGPSHQSVRDISLFGALPGLTIIEPSCASETELALSWCVEEARGSCMLRLAIGPSPRRIELPPGYRFAPGRGVLLHEGEDLLVFSYGPVMLHEVLVAAEALRSRGLGVRVVNMPWLNRVDGQWLRQLVEPYELVVTVEDHSPFGGLGDQILRFLAAGDLLRERRVWTLGVNEVPVCGAPSEVLGHHGLDGATLATRFVEIAKTRGLAEAVGPVEVDQGSDADAAIG
jgi:transketolase